MGKEAALLVAICELSILPLRVLKETPRTLGFRNSWKKSRKCLTDDHCKVRPWAREPATQTDDCTECDWIGVAACEFAISIACCRVEGNSGTHAETTDPKLHCTHGFSTLMEWILESSFIFEYCPASFNAWKRSFKEECWSRSSEWKIHKTPSF